MPWTLQDLRKVHMWEKHVSLRRCAFKELAVYEMLPAKGGGIRALLAKAQLIQNYRSKVQASLDGRSWAQG